jgi:hypothetical protein
VLSLLVTVRLFWGGCISCPQFFMFPTEKADKSCCNKAGKCERPDKTAPENECKRCRWSCSHLLPRTPSLQLLSSQRIFCRSRPLAVRPAPEHTLTRQEGSTLPRLIELHSKFLI